MFSWEKRTGPCLLLREKTGRKVSFALSGALSILLFSVLQAGEGRGHRGVLLKL